MKNRPIHKISALCQGIFFAMILVMLPFNLIAQDLTVKSFDFVANDLSASVSPRLDLNGNACALIKVVMPEELSSAEGNVVGGIVRKGRENWVYMSEGTKEIKLIPNASLPKSIFFSDYGVSTVKGKCTYVLELVRHSYGEIEKSTLLINYTPKTATVLIDSKLYKGNGTLNLSLSIGSHDYIIAEEGYDSAEGTIKMKSGANNQLNITLLKSFTVLESNKVSEFSSVSVNQTKTNPIKYGLTRPKSIKGIVYESVKNREPVIGASILIDKTRYGTVSDIDGNFTFEALPIGSQTLTVSYIGFKKKVIKLYDDMDENIVVYMK